MKYTSLAIILLILFGFCDITDHRISEGVIEYKITYFTDEKENPIVALLPETIKLNFKDDKTIIMIDGYMGFFDFFYITDSENNLNTTAFRVMGKTYLYKAETGTIAYGYGDLSGMQLQLIPDSKVVADYMCNKAIAVFQDDRQPVEIFYTKDIDIESPNINNPFKELDGVMLEFQANIMGIDMKFEAIKIEGKEVSKHLFELPNDHIPVSWQELDSIVRRYQNERPEDMK